MILSAIAEKLKRRSKDDFKGRHFEAALILQAVSWYLRYPVSYRDIEELFLTGPQSRGNASGGASYGCWLRKPTCHIVASCAENANGKDHRC